MASPVDVRDARSEPDREVVRSRWSSILACVFVTACLWTVAWMAGSHPVARQDLRFARQIVVTPMLLVPVIMGISLGANLRRWRIWHYVAAAVCIVAATQLIGSRTGALLFLTPISGGGPNSMMLHWGDVPVGMFPGPYYFIVLPPLGAGLYFAITLLLLLAGGGVGLWVRSKKPLPRGAPPALTIARHVLVTRDPSGGADEARVQRLAARINAISPILTFLAALVGSILTFLAATKGAK